MRVGFSADGARRALNEIITGLWSFTDAQGFLTDDINERTGGAGVTIDGLLIRDSGIPEGAVTAHEAALAILESQIPDGSIFPRLANTEIITGLYVFSHSSGFLTNVISERTAAAGVTIDGVQLKDTIVRLLGKALAGDNVLQSDVTGDTASRFVLHADGSMEFGPGDAARDTNLFRPSSNRLRTDDSFEVGSEFKVDGPEIKSVQLITLPGTMDDMDLDGKTIQGLLSSAIRDITGLAGGFDGKVVMLQNRNSTHIITLKHSDAGSLSANRFVLEGNVDRALPPRGGIILYYDGDLTKWAPLS